MGTVLVKT